MKFLVFDVVMKLCLVGVLSQDIFQPASPKPDPSTIDNRSNHSNSIHKVTNTIISNRNNGNFVCPNKVQNIPFLSLPCEYDDECSIFGRQMVCCLKRCIKGVTTAKTDIIPTRNRSTDLTVIVVTTTTTPRTTTTPTTSTTTTRSALATTTKETGSENINILSCPSKNVRIPFFSLPCNSKSDCSIFGSRMLCCSGRCVDGLTQQKESQLIQNEKPDKDSSNSIDRSTDVPTRVDIQKIEKSKAKQNSRLVCPEGVRIPFFSLLCTTDTDCSVLGNKMVCCKNRCINGVLSFKDEINQNVKEDKQLIARMHIRERSSDQVANSNIANEKVIDINDTTNNNLICPEGVRIPFFSRPCVTNSDCLSSGKEMVCCSDRCMKGVLPPKPEIIHSPSWFGLVDRNCPVDPIVEILEIKECETDADCRPRICCPDKYHNNSNRSYCRTPQPSLNRFPLANRATEPLRVFTSYIQCTPPPPPIFDLFPKSCNNTLECFPNLCCQEGDKKYCRPPKRSVLQLIAGVGQRFVPPDAAKRLIERLN